MNLYTYKLEGLTHKTNYWVSVRGINTKFDLDGIFEKLF